MMAIDWNDMRIRSSFYYMNINISLGATSQQNFARDENYGVIFNVINLYCDLKFEEAVVALMSVLASQLLSQGVYFEPVGCKDVKVNVKMNDIKRALASVKPNDKWLHGNLLKQVKATCFSPERQFAPDYNQGAKMIAEHFQERIKNLVFKMIETHSKMMEDSTFQVYPECQTVQYMLPCFVASFLDLEKSKYVSQEKKKKYLKFVHELVKSYEEKEFLQTFVKGWTKKGWFIAYFQSKLLNWKLSHWIKNIRDCLPKEITYGDALSTFCGKILNFLTADICGSLRASFFEVKGVTALKPWSLQMFMFLCRINSTLEDLNWLEDSRFHAVNFMAGMAALMRPTFDIKHESNNPFNNLLDMKSMSDFCMQLYRCDHQCYPQSVKPYCDCVEEMITYLFMGAKDVIPKKGKDREDVYKAQGPPFPVDTTDAMLWNFKYQKYWKLMHQIKGIMAKCSLLKNTPLTMTLQHARESRDFLWGELTPEGKVKMSQPGQITFFPVEHCRWCGLVEVTQEFRKCSECLQNSDYLDVNIFCSEVCEKEALEKQHMEEHARFLMEKCGLLH